MKLKTRLIIAFFVIICVPLLLAGVSLVGFSTYQIRNLEDHLGISGVTYENMSDSVQVLNKATNSNFEQIKAKGSENPDAFLNRDYLDQLNDELKEKYSFLIVRKGDSLYYSGSDESVNKLFPELPEYSDVVSQSDSGVYIGKDVKAFVKQMDLTFSDQTEGSVFVITSLTMVRQIRTLTRDMLVSIVIILIMTAGMLTMWIYNGINIPLKKLKEATQNIKEGNLDFSIDYDEQDEMGDLCRNFEEMRKRLKESTEEKMAAEKENQRTAQGIERAAKKWSGYAWQSDGLLIRPIGSYRELVTEGQKLKHCVANYAKSYAQGQCKLFCIRREAEPGEPYYTLELGKDNALRQYRGYRNDVENNYQPQPQVKRFVEKWMKTVVEPKKKHKSRKRI